MVCGTYTGCNDRPYIQALTREFQMIEADNENYNNVVSSSVQKSAWLMKGLICHSTYREASENINGKFTQTEAFCHEVPQFLAFFLLFLSNQNTEILRGDIFIFLRHFPRLSVSHSPLTAIIWNCSNNEAREWRLHRLSLSRQNLHMAAQAELKFTHHSDQNLSHVFHLSSYSVIIKIYILAVGEKYPEKTETSSSYEKKLT